MTARYTVQYCEATCTFRRKTVTVYVYIESVDQHQILREKRRAIRFTQKESVICFQNERKVNYVKKLTFIKIKVMHKIYKNSNQSAFQFSDSTH